MYANLYSSILLLLSRLSLDVVQVNVMLACTPVLCYYLSVLEATFSAKNK